MDQIRWRKTIVQVWLYINYFVHTFQRWERDAYNVAGMVLGWGVRQRKYVIFMYYQILVFFKKGCFKSIMDIIYEKYKAKK